MRHAALLAAVVVLLSAVAPGVAAATTAQSPAATTSTQPDLQSLTAAPGTAPSLAVGVPRTNFTISLRDDGSARWTVETTIPLDDETDREAFREYARAYENGEADGGPSIELFRNAADQASEATDREMAVGQVNRTATLNNASGTLALRFTWSGFLAPGENDALVLGDAFSTPGNGTWLGSLGASQRLVIVPPEDYEVSDVSDGFRRSITDRRIVVEGPQTFERGDVEIAYSPTARGGDFPLAWIVGGGALLLVAVAVVAYRRGGLRADGVPLPGSDSGDDDAAVEEPTLGNGGSDAVTGDPAGSGESRIGRPSDPEGIADGDGDSVAAGSGSPAAVADDGGEAEEDLELLSDEERVERLLDRNGGRMRQGDIVGGTGWSDAKVSQLLSAMADEGRIEKLRLGRENLISLADEAEGDAGDAGTDGGAVDGARDGADR